MVYGVTRIDLPSCNWGDALRGKTVNDTTVHSGTPNQGTLDKSTLDKSTLANSESQTFVVGPENRLAAPALERLLTGDNLPQADIFNPLVLLGSPGTGKSQLAHAITRHWREKLGQPAVGYFTAVDFARQLRTARESGELSNFREALTSLQLLVIEDLHRIPSRAFIQRELRDTLDLLHETDAIVVVTAQQPPAAMAGLEQGLRDRLASGLTIRLQIPGLEARRELLAMTAATRGIELDAEQLNQLAHNVEGPAPQIFRALAEYELAANNLPVDSTRSSLTLKQIIAVVARYFSLTQAALCSSGRRKSLVHARGVAIYLARTLTDLSYAQIGKSLGGRDHSTVMHADRTIKKRLASDARDQRDIEELKRILTAV